MFPVSKSSPQPAGPPGFTLVELLVALGLVSLLLLMFAQVFQIATGTMTTQRGVMENDQRARSITTVLTNDLKARSMRHMLPYQPLEDTPDSTYLYPSFHAERFNTPHGFFSVSENDNTLDNDDVLHFTAWVTDPSAQPYYGRAVTLPITAPAPSPDPRILNHPNQPDADDGQVVPNRTGSSSMAEIVYFLRNGNLYRRVLLIREPLVRTGPDAMNSQPRDGSDGRQNEFFNPLNPLLSTPAPYYYPFGSDFWNDFDYSARSGSATSGARFPGAGVSNVYNNPLNNAAGTGFFPLAIPLYRFGHNPDAAAGNENGAGASASIGNPREYVGATYIGRFTQEETSHPRFNFPHSLSSDADDHNTTTGIPTTLVNDGNPMKIVAGTNPLTDADGNFVVDQYAQGPRRGEDIILTNVHGFDVKVWDEIIGDFVDVGHGLSNSGVNGDFHQSRNRRPTFGGQAAGNRNFDTWHPQFNANGAGAVNIDDEPPFLPKIYYPNSQATGSGTHIGVWQAGTSYAVNDLVMTPRGSYAVPNCESLAFRCVTAGTTDTLVEPAWPNIVGANVPDGSAVWQAVYNLKRVKSLKITLRYLDVTSDQMRQVTLIQSLLD